MTTRKRLYLPKSKTNARIADPSQSRWRCYSAALHYKLGNTHCTLQMPLLSLGEETIGTNGVLSKETLYARR